jgi:hypothetical protein
MYLDHFQKRYVYDDLLLARYPRHGASGYNLGSCIQDPHVQYLLGFPNAMLHICAWSRATSV